MYKISFYDLSIYHQSKLPLLRLHYSMCLGKWAISIKNNLSSVSYNISFNVFNFVAVICMTSLDQIINNC